MYEIHKNNTNNNRRKQIRTIYDGQQCQGTAPCEMTPVDGVCEGPMFTMTKEMLMGGPKGGRGMTLQLLILMIAFQVIKDRHHMDLHQWAIAVLHHVDLLQWAVEGDHRLLLHLV
jgi:hypothetical protein